MTAVYIIGSLLYRQCVSAPDVVTDNAEAGRTFVLNGQGMRIEGIASGVRA